MQNYFLYVYDGLRPALQEVLASIREESDVYRYLFTGHSLGGAITVVAAVDAFT